jgi:hypothetical protein
MLLRPGAGGAIASRPRGLTNTAILELWAAAVFMSLNAYDNNCVGP